MKEYAKLIKIVVLNKTTKAFLENCKNSNLNIRFKPFSVYPADEYIRIDRTGGRIGIISGVRLVHFVNSEDLRMHVYTKKSQIKNFYEFFFPGWYILSS